MKRKTTNKDIKVNGLYMQNAAIGFWGEQNEGGLVLEAMGLPSDVLPFSVATFLQNRRTRWRDTAGEVATISFRFKPDQIECFGHYLKRSKSKRLFREWEGYDPERVARLESEAVGDLCMKCVYEIITT